MFIYSQLELVSEVTLIRQVRALNMVTLVRLDNTKTKRSMVDYSDVTKLVEQLQYIRGLWL